MNLGTLIGMVGAGVGGYTEGKRQKERDEDERSDRATRRELLKMQVNREKQAQADSDALRTAGQDVTPTSRTLIPTGQAAERGPNLPANPDPVTEYQVGDRTTLDGGEAQSMAAEQNTPKARLGRQVTALQKMGNPGAAAKLQTDQLQLDDAHRKHLDTMFDRSLAGLSTPDDIAKLVSESANDGMGGELKITAVPSADGKKVAYHRLAPDGTATPTGLEFENSAKGLTDAKLWLSRNTSISDKVGHLRSEAQMKAQAEDRAADNARADRQLSMTDRHYRAMEGIAGAKASNAVERLSEADKLRLSALNKQIGDIQSAITKARAEGSWDGTSQNSKDLTTQLAALQMQANGITSPGGAGALADPLGMRGDGGGRASPPAQRPGAETGVYTAPGQAVQRPLARMPVPASGGAAATPTHRVVMGQAIAQDVNPEAQQAYQRLDAAAVKAGFKPTTGKDGARYYVKQVNGAAQYVTDADMAQQLGLVWD